MPKTTKPADTELLICAQTDDTGIQASPTWYEVRGTGESNKGNMETTETGEFSDTNDVTEIVNIGEDASIQFNTIPVGDTAEEKVYELALNGVLDANNVLKAANISKWLAVRRVLINDEASYVTDVVNCVCQSLGFSIVAKELHGVNITGKGTEHIIRNVQLGYQDTVSANKIFGGDESVWLNTSTGKLYKRTKRTWGTTALNDSDVFSSGEEWSTVTIDPVASTETAQWILNTANGKVWIDNGTDAPRLVFTWLPDGSSWFSGTGVPSSSTGNANSLYIRTGDGSKTYHADIYQKIWNGTEYVWTHIMNWNNRTFDSAKWYQDNTITAKSTNSVMKFPELRDLVFMSVIGTKCVEDLSFTIENQVDAQGGRCTNNIGAEYPNYSSIEISRGNRSIKGNLNTYFYNDELQKIKKAGSAFNLQFTISNGTQAWRIIFPRAKFTDGEPTSGNSTEKAVMEGYSFTATTEESLYNAALVMQKIDSIDSYPNLYYGWVDDQESVTVAEMESMTNYSGNFEVPANPGTKYFVICTPADEPSISSLINTDNGLDELSDYEEEASTQSLGGVDYNVNASANTTTIPTAGEIFIINRD